MPLIHPLLLPPRSLLPRQASATPGHRGTNPPNRRSGPPSPGEPTTTLPSPSPPPACPLPCLPIPLETQASTSRTPTRLASKQPASSRYRNPTSRYPGRQRDLQNLPATLERKRRGWATRGCFYSFRGQRDRSTASLTRFFLCGRRRRPMRAQ